MGRLRCPARASGQSSRALVVGWCVVRRGDVTPWAGRCSDHLASTPPVVDPGPVADWWSNATRPPSRRASNVRPQLPHDRHPQSAMPSHNALQRSGSDRPSSPGRGHFADCPRSAPRGWSRPGPGFVGPMMGVSARIGPADSYPVSPDQQYPSERILTGTPPWCCRDSSLGLFASCRGRWVHTTSHELRSPGTRLLPASGHVSSRGDAPSRRVDTDDRQPSVPAGPPACRSAACSVCGRSSSADRLSKQSAPNPRPGLSRPRCRGQSMSWVSSRHEASTSATTAATRGTMNPAAVATSA